LASDITSTPKPDLPELTSVVFKIGNTTFGGGIPTIAALQRELVDRRGWLTSEDYGLAFALARITPGTTVIAFCAAAGWCIKGIAGAIAGTLAETAPSALLAVLITVGYESWRTHPLAMGAISGIIAAVAAMMWASVWSLVRPYCGGVRPAVRVAVFTGGAVLAFSRLGLTPLPIIGIAAVGGWLWKQDGA